MKYYLDLDKDIKRLANSKGLLLKDIINIIGINHVTFNDIRKKNNCSISQLFAICEAFNVPITTFIHLQEAANSNEVNEARAAYNNGPVELIKELEHCKKLCYEKDKRIELYEKLVKRL